MRFPAATIHRQISEVLRAWEMPPDVVRTAADIMTDTDLAGIDSHGISMLMLYEEALGLEQLNPRPNPRVVRETPVTALLDGDAGLGHVSASMGMRLAIEKARSAGVGIVSVFNSTHFGAAGYYAAMASRRGSSASSPAPRAATRSCRRGVRCRCSAPIRSPSRHRRVATGTSCSTCPPAPSRRTR
jgi:LDH2 family malate/lactate/ureidoglycolate dehydrogenase